MIYTKTLNKAVIEGKMSEIKFDHAVREKKLYSFNLLSYRNSGACDVIPCLVDESLINEGLENSTVCVHGKIKSFNRHIKGKTKLLFYVFVEEIIPIKNTDIYFNEVILQGFLCKESNYRRTPLGSEISDIILAVNDNFKKSYYLPCIGWNKLARILANKKVGDEVTLSCRFQSRDYTKKTDEGEIECIAHELSINKMFEKGEYKGGAKWQKD